MAKKLKIIKCAYCGQEKESTRDHVASRQLFPASYKMTRPIIVPSCRDCNHDFSLDEEYFRNFLCSINIEYSPHAREVFFSTIKRSIQRRPAIGHQAMKRMELVDTYTPNGIYIGRKTKITIPNSDWDRYYNVLDKYVKGLFYNEFNIPLPSDYRIRHQRGRREELPKICDRVHKWNIDNGEIFAFGYNYVPDTYNSIWITIFYNQVFFKSLVTTQEYLDNTKKKVV